MRARVLRGAAGVVVVAALLPAVLRVALGVAGPAGLAAQEPTGAVEVQVELAPDGTARVVERYLLTPAPAVFELRALTRPCTEILDVRVERGGATEMPTPEGDGPWVLYRPAPYARTADTLRATVRYRVRIRSADVSIPLLHLTEPIPQRDGEREGTVRVLVRFAEGGGRVRFPHMARTEEGSWQARYVAIPSFVEVTRGDGARDGATACREEPDDATPEGPGDGGLTWRFLLFVGIMAAWVPTYLWWARRSTEDGA